MEGESLMRVLVIGAGLCGLTAAHFLRKEGVDVIVLDRTSGPGLETSFANGALLHPSLSEPWNSPGVLGQMLRSLGRTDSPMLLRSHALPSLIGWGLQFIRHSTPQRFRTNALHNLRLALHSMRTLHAMRTELRLGFGAYDGGSLQLFREPTAWRAALDWARSLAADGREYQALTPELMVAMEPALAPIQGSLVGGLHFRMDQGGDAHRYCVELETALRVRGVEFRYESAVNQLLLQRGRVAGVIDDAGETWRADAVLLAAASHSRELAAGVGVALPIRPVKGYSITIPSDRAGQSPVRPVVDATLHMAVVPLRGRSLLRVAGTAEFAGYDRHIEPRRIENLLRLVRQVYPPLAATLTPQDVTPWTGLRPMCPDGVPLIGETDAPGLFVNSGHGHLGWTLAAGSGQTLAALLCGRATDLDASPYSPRRFS